MAALLYVHRFHQREVEECDDLKQAVETWVHWEREELCSGDFIEFEGKTYYSTSPEVVEIKADMKRQEKERQEGRDAQGPMFEVQVRAPHTPEWYGSGWVYEHQTDEEVARLAAIVGPERVQVVR